MSKLENGRSDKERSAEELEWIPYAPFFLHMPTNRLQTAMHEAVVIKDKQPYKDGSSLSSHMQMSFWKHMAKGMSLAIIGPPQIRERFVTSRMKNCGKAAKMLFATKEGEKKPIKTISRTEHGKEM